MAQGPWTKYQTEPQQEPQQERGPWEKYAAPAVQPQTAPRTPTHTPPPTAYAQPTLGQTVYEAMRATPQGPMVEGAMGALRGLGSTSYNILSAIPGVRSLMPTEKPEFLKPQGAMEKMGYAGEQIAEMAVPAAKIGTALKGAGLATRVGAEAAATGAMGMAQGQTPGEAAVSATIGAAIPTAGRAWYSLKDFMSRKVTPRMMNALMEVNPKWLESGRDPGGRIIKEGIVATSKDALEQKVRQNMTAAGMELEQKLAQSTGTAMNAEDLVVNALDSATKRIGIRSDAEFQRRLSGILDDITQRTQGRLANLAPLEAHRLKKEIGESIKWTGAPYEDDINQALLQIYRGLNDGIDAMVPGAKQLQARWGDLYVASKALQDSIRKDMTRPLSSGQGIFANVRKFAGGTPVQTGMARATNMFASPPNTISSPVSRLLGAGMTTSIGRERQ